MKLHLSNSAMKKKEKQKPHLIDSTDLLHFSKTNTVDAKTIHNCLINLIFRIRLGLKNFNAFASDGASVMRDVNNGVVARLRENQDLTHMLNVHCICHCLALAWADSSSQLTVLKDFEDVLIQLWPFFKNSPKRLIFMLNRS